MAESPRMIALRNMAGQLPVANSRIAQGQQAARNMQLQQAVAAAPVAAPVTQSAQQAGAAQAQNAGTQMIDTAKQALQQNQQIGQVGLQEQQNVGQAKAASLQAGQKQQAMDNVQRLAVVDENAKQQLYDAQMKFEKDQAGNTLFTEQQLADYAKVQARDDQEYQNAVQKANQLSQRNIQMIDAAYNKVAEDLRQKYNIAKQKGDEQTAILIRQQQEATAEAIQREKNRIANKQAMWAAGGTIVGTVIGAFGGPAGAVAGGSLGGAAGGMVGSQT